MKTRKSYRPGSPGNSRAAGFTLMEVLVTLAVIAIVIGFAAPTLRTLAPNMKLKGAARDLYSTLQNMRQTAIKENSSFFMGFDQPGFYYLDMDGDLAYSAGDREYPFENGVGYGTGNALKDWNLNALTPATGISFDNRGLPTVTPAAAAVFLEYVDADGNVQDTCYAVSVSTAGSIQLHKWNGNQWD